ncbi:MAG: HDOD domain-containing protein, partial [Gammaproteobacteria bacterium]|nr:HDOD domain-containing protein [Gammaproteobacteria bacterium]
MQAEELIQKGQHLWSFPAVFLRILEVLDDGKSSSDIIGDYIARDTSLTAKILRLANSPYFRGVTPIETVAVAMTRVGADELIRLILSSEVTHVFSGIPDKHISMDSFWSHSIHVSAIANTLGESDPSPSSDVYFIAGMLHDVGLLLIYRFIPELALEAHNIAQQEKISLHEAENRVMGFNHATVGGGLLSGWNLPNRLTQLVAMHHTPGLATKWKTDVARLHVADCLALDIDNPLEGEQPLPCDPTAQV